MFSPVDLAPSPTAQSGRGERKHLVALTLARLAELDRLRESGLAQAERLTAVAEGLSPLEEYRRMAGPKGTIQQFDRIAKAVRQVVVLEFELRGLFKAPDRDDFFKPRLVKENLLGDLYDDDSYNDYGDYDDLFDFEKARRGLGDLADLRVRLDYSDGPIDALIADIRQTLGVEPPENDPFAPPADRRPGQTAILERMRATVADRPTLKPRKHGVQVKPAVKAAVLAAKAGIRKGFRVPPTSVHNPNTPAARKRRRNRGPPR
ncbi:MAG TPA: hypothetical protein VL899_12025 [Alphaproteobacteria bacterium]|nr:hypothetical protein [Alphaproteobacteria bacterium]